MKKLNRILAGGLAILSVATMLGGCQTVNTTKDSDIPTLVWYVPGDNGNVNKSAVEIYPKFLKLI